MPKKIDVDLLAYNKNSRRLSDDTEAELGVAGMLHPFLDAVAHDPRLRLEIRDGYFNIYYDGGSLLRVRQTRKGWEAHFDEKYFRKTLPPKNRPSPAIASAADTHHWVKMFPALKEVMEGFRDDKASDERRHCQGIARVNSGRLGPPPGDYLILDIEYQWAQCRFDLIAARRNPRKADPEGWSVPKLVFVEVKSNLGACIGPAGLFVHARDYASIVGTGGGSRQKEIRMEYESVVRQKENLGLIDRRLGFEKFSGSVPELLLVFVGMSPDDNSQIIQAMNKVRPIAQQRPSRYIHKMFLPETDLVMTMNKRNNI